MKSDMFDTKEYLATPSGRIRYIRGLLGLSRADLERRYGIPKITIKSWENGTVRITQEAVNRCLAMYRAEGVIMSSEWIMEGVGLPPRTSRAVSSYFSSLDEQALLSDNDAQYCGPENDELLALNDAELFKKHGQDRIVMMVCSDEMMPFFSSGDLIGGRLRRHEKITEGANRNCIVIIEGGIQFFRRVVQNGGSGYNLVILNPSSNTQEPVIFDAPIIAVAPVIWHRVRDV